MPDEVIEGFRLSPQQQRVWLLQRESQAPAYQLLAEIVIEGSLRPSTLHQALADVTGRYEILRTLFRTPFGMGLPVQVIHPTLPAEWIELDLSGRSPAEQATDIEDARDRMATQPFDFATGPLLSATLVRLSDAHHRLLLRLPALWGDPFSVSTLMRELAAASAGPEKGPGGGGEEETILQFADLAEWQHEMSLEDPSSDTATDGADPGFWRALDFPALLRAPLPLNRRGYPDRVQPQAHLRSLPTPLADDLRAFATDQGLPLSAVFLAAWQVLLWRLSGHTEGAVGAACDGRTYDELQGAVGPLSKYLPVRHRLIATQSFASVAKSAQAALTAALEWHESFSWATIGGSTPQYFPIGFDFIDHRDTVMSGGLSFALEDLTHCLERFDLNLVGLDTGSSIRVRLNFDAGLYSAAEIERIAAELEQLLRSALEDADRPIEALDILPDGERHRLLVEFNHTHAPTPGGCIHEMIERHAEGRPEHPAVAFADRDLTYAELNGRANQVAHHLRDLGVGPGTLVGVNLTRTPDMVIGLLGVLKAGGAYVPLNADYPPEQLALILKDTRAPVLVTESGLRENEIAFPGDIVCLDSDWPKISLRARSNPASGVTSDDLAYVMYTSGSTGIPKGVCIRHRNLVHSTSARALYYREPVERFLLLSSYFFDSSVAGLFWPLCTGATLVLPEEGLQRDAREIARVIGRWRISHMLCLPSLYAYVLSEAGECDLGSLHTVIVAGETCPRNLVERHRAFLPQTALYNEYGPTEGTVWCSVHDCVSEPLGTTVPIGKPIANARLYVLDEQLQPVPIGVAGELHLGGEGLARGYLNDPELTARKFIASPFDQELLYKTGDLGRYRSDGSIEFLGRADEQVKILGHRIELGEIESILQQHPLVDDAVVVARDRQANTSSTEPTVDLSDDPAALADSLRRLDEAEAEELLLSIEALDETRAAARLADLSDSR